MKQVDVLEARIATLQSDNDTLRADLQAANDEVKALKELPQSLRDSTLTLTQGRWLNKHGGELKALRKVAKAARTRLIHGHNDTCDLLLGSHPCNCGQSGLVLSLSALDAARGKEGGG